MSQPDLTSQPRTLVVQKPKSNIYTALLGIAALSLLVGCIFLAIEITRYAADASVSGWFGAIRGPA